MNSHSYLSDNGDELLSDAELAALERAIESRGDSAIHDDASRTGGHRETFQLVDRWSAPIRLALAAIDGPPVLEDYDELVEIGRGGMGVVFRGLHKKTQRREAIKVMRSDRLLGTSETSRLLRIQFLRESQLAARVAHEHIVPVYQVGESRGRPWYSMQLVDGGSLHELVRAGAVSTERVVCYMQQIARALDAVHRHGILHGDIKPQNILIERGSDRPMIGDFGLADLDAASTELAEFGVGGTPAFMAPEVAEAVIKRPKTDELAATRSVSSDVYSLGLTLWAALTNRSPCPVDGSPREQLDAVVAGDLLPCQALDASIPSSLQRLIQSCASRDPTKRPETAGEFAAALEAWLTRPQWNRHFPRLRKLLCVVIAPLLLAAGALVQWSAFAGASEFWTWIGVFGPYAGLFAVFAVSQNSHRGTHPARRELWSIWIGHLIVSFAGMIAMRILCGGDVQQLLAFYYPVWASISALAFFAKSGNFWSGYRWLGVCWSLFAVLLALSTWAPLAFGLLAAATCMVIAGLDRSFLDH